MDSTLHFGKPRRKLLIGIMLIIGGLTGLVLSRISSPTLFSFTLGGDPISEPQFVVFNPLYDHRPKEVADNFLQSMKNNKCAELLSALRLPKNKQEDICSREEKYPLVSWSLHNWTGDATNARLYYRVWRDNSVDTFGQLWITLENKAGQWRVVDYESWY